MSSLRSLQVSVRLVPVKMAMANGMVLKTSVAETSDDVESLENGLLGFQLVLFDTTASQLLLPNLTHLRREFSCLALSHQGRWTHHRPCKHVVIELLRSGHEMEPGHLVVHHQVPHHHIGVAAASVTCRRRSESTLVSEEGSGGERGSHCQGLPLGCHQEHASKTT